MESVKNFCLEWGVAGRALPGFSESGDRHVFRPTRDGALLAVVDGLGHGREAAASALEARAMLESHAGENVIELIKRCHAGLNGMRGVVMSLASFNFRDGLMTWVGVGNVLGRLLRLDSAISGGDESLLLRPGVVGSHLPPLQASILPVFAGDYLIFATDGVEVDFDHSHVRSQPPQEAAEELLAHYAKDNDDALVVIARYIGTSS
jgi:negative regulator of sigma-B (phosphoserine phosphatase)